MLAGAPPGVPLDSLLGQAPASGALGGRAFVRAGPRLEFDPRVFRRSGVDSGHVGA